MARIPSRCWVIAAGDTDRNYTDICIKHGVILMGPGSYGPLTEICNITEYKKHSSHRTITILNRFLEIQPDDLVILRLGISQIYAVGYIVRKEHHIFSYQHSEFFGDIDGWDLHHFHHVQWIWHGCKHFEKALNFGDTTQKFERTEKNEQIFQWIEELPDTEDKFSPQEFVDGKVLNVQDITTKLYDYGLGAGSISDIDEQILDLCRLAKWYTEYGIAPSEAETVSHLVTPLLLSLGWTPQRIALELHIPNVGRADLALFPNGNRKDYEPIAIIEAKKLNQSCLNASEQVRKYAENLQYVRRLIVTDGIRYGMFIRYDKEDTFPRSPSAYLNLTRLRDSYPVYGDQCGGADEVMLSMSAAWSHRFLPPKKNK